MRRKKNPAAAARAIGFIGSKKPRVLKGARGFFYGSALGAAERDR